MAIIYTYPVKTNPVGNDLILISDSADSNKTKQIKVSSLPSSGAGISLTTTGTSGPAELNGTVLNIPNYATVPSLPLNGVQYRNANGNFDASTKLTYTDSTRILNIGDQDVFGAIVNISGGQNGGAGQLRLGDNGTSGGAVALKAATDIPGDYNIVLPSTAPGSNNKILESDLSGQLSWIDTPTGSGDTYTLGAGTKAGVSIPLKLDATTGSDSTVNFTEGANITLTSSGATEITIASSGGGGDVGFSPMSIYEGQNPVGSGGVGGIGNLVTFARQTVIENECTINNVDFFRLEGDQDVSVHVYKGTIANANNAGLVLSGTESGGNVNEINKLPFNKTGYETHTFSAGDPVVILVSFDYVSGAVYSNAIGHDGLYRLPNLSALGNTYYNVNNIPLTLSDALDQLEDGNQYGVSLHFYS